MKRIALLAILVCIISSNFAQTVNLDAAHNYATRFLSQKQMQKSVQELKLIYTDVNHTQKTAVPKNNFYIFTCENGGFVMVSADKRCKPILAYSTTSTFDTTGMPDQLRNWLRAYREEIVYTLANDSNFQIPAHPDWINAPQTDEIVSPLIQTHWNQSTPYNALCPMDIASQTRCLTGCVATAMAQVMNFWKYPIQGKDTYSYKHPTYGTQTANFSSTTYDWNHMLNTYTSGYTQETVDAISTLMYHCGISINMKYSPRGSDGNTYFNVPGFVDARGALMEHFGYDTTIGKIRDNFDPEFWEDMLKEELDNGRPMMYRGTGYGGHSFVCDGYDSEDHFHFNWGWGGACDGFYSLNTMNPNGYDFSQYQAAVFIQPQKDTTNYNLGIQKQICVSHDTAFLDSTLQFSAKVYNLGNQNYSGAFAIGLFALNGEWIGSLAEKHHQKIPHKDSLLLNFQWKNLNEFQPGPYIIKLCYIQSKRWVCIKDNSLNYARLLVTGSTEEKRLQLLEDIHMLNADTLKANDTLKLRYRIGGGKKPCMISYIVHIPYLIGEEYDYEYIGEHLIVHPEDETQQITIPISRMSGKISGRYALNCTIADRTTGEKVVANGHSDSCSFFYQADVSDLRINGMPEINPNPVRLNQTFEIRFPVNNRGNIAYTNNTYVGIYDTSLQLLAYAGPIHKCQLAPNENDTLKFNTINKKKVLKAGESYYACLLYNSANSSTDQMLKTDKGEQNLLKFSVVPIEYSTGVVENTCIRLYPNPATDYLQIDLSCTSEIQILSMEGKLVYRANFPEGKNRIPFVNYPKGTYLVRISGTNGCTQTFKLVLQ